MKTFIIGRSAKSDIRIARDTVSGRHAELVVTDDGRYYLTDLNSTGGTFVADPQPAGGTPWKRITQAYIQPGQAILLADYETSIGALLAVLPPPPRPVDPPPAPPKPTGGRVRRNPQTGEIIRE